MQRSGDEHRERLHQREAVTAEVTKRCERDDQNVRCADQCHREQDAAQELVPCDARRRAQSEIPFAVMPQRDRGYARARCTDQRDPLEIQDVRREAYPECGKIERYE